ncbi:apolipoprotein A-I-like [Clinocottus analis]|uniref:apolipoprotein A-I-like n=1 Tax=Clinocottus analis TaxID=304258 RepID=UPI0035C10958
MKFVALALALFLAVGSNAASLQADAPSQLAHARAAMDVYLTQVKDSANKALDQLDDTEYKELKMRLSQRIEDMYTQIKTLQGVVSPVTDSVVSTIADATAEFRTTVMTDIDNLKAQLEPKRVALKEVVDRHIEEYRKTLDPLITEYSAKHAADMEALRIKMEPIVEDLRSKVATNVEETKTALMPIVDAVRAKLSEHLEQLKTMVSPYVEEYKDQMKQAYDQAQGVSADDLAALKEKIQPLAEDIKLKLTSIFELVANSISKQ